MPTSFFHIFGNKIEFVKSVDNEPETRFIFIYWTIFGIKSIAYFLDYPVKFSKLFN